jgi:hypothetical protein
MRAIGMHAQDETNAALPAAHARSTTATELIVCHLPVRVMQGSGEVPQRADVDGSR